MRRVHTFLSMTTRPSCRHTRHRLAVQTVPDPSRAASTTKRPTAERVTCLVALWASTPAVTPASRPIPADPPAAPTAPTAASVARGAHCPLEATVEQARVVVAAASLVERSRHRRDRHHHQQRVCCRHSRDPCACGDLCEGVGVSAVPSEDHRDRADGGGAHVGDVVGVRRNSVRPQRYLDDSDLLTT